MSRKFQEKAFAVAAAHLSPGEAPRVAARAMAGALDAGRLGTAVTRGVVPGVSGAVADVVLATTGKQVVVVTDRRVLFLSQTFWGGAGDRLLGSVRRELVSLAEAKFGAVSVLRLAFGPGGGVSLTFPRIDRSSAEALAAELRGHSAPR
ncbi:hypothetical protein ACQP2F_12960 [Actinoplanes sp. CA-030573]|uniref:hypothetical protein n=1 Tax=Actinoplanes sp. CA-030573 TaxID=3239898 RepID=UPI003D929182